MNRLARLEHATRRSQMPIAQRRERLPGPLQWDLPRRRRQQVRAVETVQFALDGVYYELDLSAAGAGELRATLAP